MSRGVFLAPFLSIVQPSLNDVSIANVAIELEKGRPVPLLYLGDNQFINSTDVGLAMGMLSAAWDSDGRTHTIAIVGSGCGYVPAVAAEAGMDVAAIELRQDIAEISRDTLASQGYSDVQVNQVNAIDFFNQTQAQFDAIAVFAALPMTRAGVAARKLFQSKLTQEGKIVFPFGQPDSCLIQVYDNSSEVATWPFACRFTPFILE